MLPIERLAYSAIKDRTPLTLPGGARLAVWVIVNVEEWNPRETMPRTVLTPPAGGSPMPDIPNWAWHEYGNRVGFWRMLEVFDRFNIRAALAINGSAIHAYEPIARAAHGARMGVRRPWLRPEEHAEGPRRASRHRQDHGGHSGLHGQTAARLAWAGP